MTEYAAPVCAPPPIPMAALSKDEACIADPAPNQYSISGLVELLLKDPFQVDRLARDETRQLSLVPALLAIGLVSFGMFALGLTLTIGIAPAEAVPVPLAEHWSAHRMGSALALWLAYALGFTATTGVCLPSFYFYGLLAGVRVSWAQVTAQIMKGQAATAVILVGIMPVYMTVALGGIIFAAPTPVIQGTLYAGLMLPFVAGLWGVRSIYLGFMSLADTLPPQRSCQRERWLCRLTATCSACYTAVCPVMIYTLWVYFADHLAWVGL